MSKLINLQTASEEERQCKDGILEEYVFFSQETECHEDFHYWMGINIIASAMGRKYFMDMGFGNVYPNLYTVLVGEAGLSGKSTAIGMAANVYKDAFAGSDVPFIAQQITPSMLIGELGRIEKEGGEDSATGILVSDELATLLGNTQRDDEILKVLTTLWDCKDEFELSTRMRGREKIHNVCLNLWGGSTPSWLKGGIPESSLEGGFFSRLILVNRPRGGKRIALPYLTMTEDHTIARNNVVHDLARIILSRGGVFTLSKEAARMYTEWYEEQLEDEVEKANKYMRGYFARKRTSVLKLAMAISISRDDELVMTKSDIHDALTLLEKNEVFLMKIISYLGSSKEGLDLQYVQAAMVQLWRGPRAKRKPNGKLVVSHSDLLRKISHKFPIQQIEGMLRLLEDSGFVEITPSPSGRGRQYVTTKDSFSGAENIS